MEWLRQGPDVNPIDFKKAVHKHKTLKLGELKLIWQKQWAKNSSTFCCKTLIASRNKHLTVVVSPNGGRLFRIAFLLINKITTTFLHLLRSGWCDKMF